MDVKDSISVTLKTIDGKETKDQSAKNIFSYKPIMSNILKYTVEEYRDCSLEEIMNCIEGDTIQIGTALVRALVVIIVVKWFRYIYAKEKRKCRIMYIQFLYLKQDRT